MQWCELCLTLNVGEEINFSLKCEHPHDYKVTKTHRIWEAPQHMSPFEIRARVPWGAQTTADPSSDQFEPPFWNAQRRQFKVTLEDAKIRGWSFRA